MPKCIAESRITDEGNIWERRRLYSERRWAALQVCNYTLVKYPHHQAEIHSRGSTLVRSLEDLRERCLSWLGLTDRSINLSSSNWSTVIFMNLWPACNAETTLIHLMGFTYQNRKLDLDAKQEWTNPWRRMQSMYLGLARFYGARLVDTPRIRFFLSSSEESSNTLLAQVRCSERL